MCDGKLKYFVPDKRKFEEKGGTRNAKRLTDRKHVYTKRQPTITSGNDAN